MKYAPNPPDSDEKRASCDIRIFRKFLNIVFFVKYEYYAHIVCYLSNLRTIFMTNQTIYEK